MKNTSLTLLEIAVDRARSIRTDRVDCHVVLKDDALSFLVSLDGRLAGMGVHLDVLDEDNLDLVWKRILEFVADYFKEHLDHDARSSDMAIRPDEPIAPRTGKFPKIESAGLRGARETAKQQLAPQPSQEGELCECPKCGRMHKSLGFGKPPHFECKTRMREPSPQGTTMTDLVERVARAIEPFESCVPPSEYAMGRARAAIAVCLDDQFKWMLSEPGRSLKNLSDYCQSRGIALNPKERKEDEDGMEPRQFHGQEGECNHYFAQDGICIYCHAPLAASGGDYAHDSVSGIAQRPDGEDALSVSGMRTDRERPYPSPQGDIDVLIERLRDEGDKMDAKCGTRLCDEAADALAALTERAEMCERFELRHRKQIDVLIGENRIRDIQLVELRAALAAAEAKISQLEQERDEWRARANCYTGPPDQ